MADAYAIVVDDVTAGLVVRRDRGRGFHFHASERRFFPIDGLAFSTPRAAERAARRLLAVPGTARLGRAA
jgi:hypothetical protein